MKEFLLLLFIASCPLIVMAQEFSTQIIFEDANGATDTLVIGYDKSASNEIDTIFGERNIFETNWNDVFECRFIDVEPFANMQCKPYSLADTLFSIQSKKQIVGNRKCFGTYDETVGIAISNAEYPIKVKYQSFAFENDACIYESLITDWQPYAWFDIGGCGNQDYHFLRNSSGEVMFEKPLYSVFKNSQQSQDLLFIYLGANESWGNVTVLKSTAYKVYPSPVEDIANFLNYQGLIQILSSDGKWLSNIELFQNNKVDFSQYQPGVYFLKFENGEVKRLVKK